jgi:transcriptional regulator with XRE-family HTH domain
MNDWHKARIEEFLNNNDAKMLLRDINELFEAKKKLEYDSTENKAIFHSMSSFHMRALDSQIKSIDTKMTLGKFLKKIAAQKEVYQFSDKVFANAEIDRSYWSKLLNDVKRHPSRNMLIRIAFALKFDLLETVEMLSLAGYSLNANVPRDCVIMYCLEVELFDLLDLDDYLESRNLESIY